MDNVFVRLQKSTQRYVDKYRHIEIHVFIEKQKFLYVIYSFRNKLPMPMFDRSQISIWSILKQCIGKVNIHFRDVIYH
jgi:hypothetical protein